MTDPYQGRTQTKAKHFILRRYLETLTYKLFASGYRELTYVDGFSGPWGSKTDTFADTSFMIAIDVLKNAHWQFRAKNKLKITKCFFVEKTRSPSRNLRLPSDHIINRPTIFT